MPVLTQRIYHRQNDGSSNQVSLYSGAVVPVTPLDYKEMNALQYMTKKRSSHPHKKRDDALLRNGKILVRFYITAINFNDEGSALPSDEW